MSLVVECTDVGAVVGDPASGCTNLVLKEEATFWDPSLSLADVSDLLAAILFTFALVYGFRFVLSFALNKR